MFFQISNFIPKYVCKFLKHILCYYPEAYSGGLRGLIPLLDQWNIWWGRVSFPPPNKKKKCKPFLGKKTWIRFLNIFKTMSYFSVTLKSVKIQKWRPRDTFRRSSFFGITNCTFLVFQIMHPGVIVQSEIIYCGVKWLKFTSETLIYVNLY